MAVVRKRSYQKQKAKPLKSIVDNLQLRLCMLTGDHKLSNGDTCQLADPRDIKKYGGKQQHPERNIQRIKRVIPGS